jgi:hypothetical protein
VELTPRLQNTAAPTNLYFDAMIGLREMGAWKDVFAGPVHVAGHAGTATPLAGTHWIQQDNFQVRLILVNERVARGARGVARESRDLAKLDAASVESEVRGGG